MLRVLTIINQVFFMIYYLVWNKERKRKWQYYAVIVQEN